MSALPEGFEQPLFRSLTEPILLAGAPRNLAIVNATLSLSIALGLKLWLAGAILGLLGHGAAMLAARHDPQLLGVLARHLRLPPHLAV